MLIEIKDIFDEFSIEYRTSGKNLGVDWTGIECPNCGDARNHCAINPTGTGYSCFVCGTKGGTSKLLRIILRKTFPEIKEILKRFSNKFYVDKKSPVNNVPDLVLPGEKELPELHKDYLINRGFSPSKIQEQFGVQAEYQTGRNKYRIMVPIYFNQELVNYAGRDVTDKQALRYLYPPSSEVKMSIGQVIYGWDDIEKTALLTEGIFDQWKMSTMIPTIGVLGTVVTDAQIRILKNLKRVWILFDNSREAQKKAQQLLGILSFCGVIVKNISWTKDLPQISKKFEDPGDFGKKEIQYVKQLVGL